MKTFLGITAGLTAAAIWGGMYVVSKVVLEVVPPFALLSIRLTLGALLLGAILAALGQPRLGGDQIRQALGIGMIGFGISLGLQFVGTRLSTASNASLVTSASPAFMLLFAAWLLRERVTLRRLSALGLATAGVVAVIDPRTIRLAPKLFVGNLALLGAAVAWGLYSVLVKTVSERATILQVGFYTFLGGLIIAVPAALVEARAASIGHLNTFTVLGIFYLGWISTALAVYLWNQSLALLDAGAVSLLFFAQPVVGIILGAWLLGERLGALFWGGAGLVGAGLMLSLLERPASTALASRSQWRAGGVEKGQTL
ncbi:MAG: DMT family transporter [Anaerolineales bacterium]